MRARLVATAVIFFVSMPVFCHRVLYEDHLFHIDYAQKLSRREITVPHPLFHLTLLALMGGDPGGHPPVVSLGIVACMMSTGLAARAWLTLLYINRPLSPVFATLLCLALAVALPFPNWWSGHPYNGSVTPNAWHSPTGLFAMPFCLALFLLANRLLERPDPRMALVVGLVAGLGLMAKPNYFMAFAPCFGLLLLLTLFRTGGRIAPKLLIVTLAFTLPACVLTAQYVWLTSDLRPSCLRRWRSGGHTPTSTNSVQR